MATIKVERIRFNVKIDAEIRFKNSIKSTTIVDARDSNGGFDGYSYVDLDEKERGMRVLNRRNLPPFKREWILKSTIIREKIFCIKENARGREFTRKYITPRVATMACDAEGKEFYSHHIENGFDSYIIKAKKGVLVHISSNYRDVEEDPILITLSLIFVKKGRKKTLMELKFRSLEGLKEFIPTGKYEKTVKDCIKKFSGAQFR